METPRDPGTRTVLSADDLQLSFWAELAERRISVTNAEILHCVQNDMLAVGIPYFFHVPYCLAHDAGLRGKDLLLMRLAALAHEVPTSGWDILLTRSTGLSGDELAWLRRVKTSIAFDRRSWL